MEKEQKEADEAHDTTLEPYTGWLEVGVSDETYQVHQLSTSAADNVSEMATGPVNPSSSIPSSTKVLQEPLAVLAASLRLLPQLIAAQREQLESLPRSSRRSVDTDAGLIYSTGLAVQRFVSKAPPSQAEARLGVRALCRAASVLGRRLQQTDVTRLQHLFTLAQAIGDGSEKVIGKLGETEWAEKLSLSEAADALSQFAHSFLIPLHQLLTDWKEREAILLSEMLRKEEQRTPQPVFIWKSVGPAASRDRLLPPPAKNEGTGRRRDVGKVRGQMVEKNPSPPPSSSSSSSSSTTSQPAINHSELRRLVMVNLEEALTELDHAAFQNCP